MLGTVKIALEGGSLQNYPFTRFTAYAMPYTRNGGGSGYKDAYSPRFLKAYDSKRRWRVAHRLTAAELQTLRDFYKAHLVQPFNFVDRINDLSCKAVFTGTFQEKSNPDHFSVSVELSEVV
jgi:hypothetical protein